MIFSQWEGGSLLGGRLLGSSFLSLVLYPTSFYVSPALMFSPSWWINWLKKALLRALIFWSVTKPAFVSSFMIYILSIRRRLIAWWKEAWLKFLIWSSTQCPHVSSSLMVCLFLEKITGQWKKAQFKILLSKPPPNLHRSHPPSCFPLPS